MIAHSVPLFAAAILLATPATARPQTHAWATMTIRDVGFLRDYIARADIYATIGDPGFARALDRATAQAVAAAPTARSLTDYQSIVKRYVGALQDPHARVSFTVAPTALQWAGFLVRMRGDRYVVVGSQDPRIVDGAEVEGCDGRPVDAILDARAPLEQAIPGLQAMRSLMARLMTVDAGNPFYTRVAVCRIGGTDIPVEWRAITADAWAVTNAAFPAFRDWSVWSKPFGQNGAWVRMGIFFAPDAKVAEQYHALYARLPELRDKDVIVVDVRGNGGGSYNWFMGFIRALYGDDYAAYYARARLKIRPLYANDPGRPDPQTPGTARQPDIPEPVDGPLKKAEGAAVRLRLPNGRYVYQTPAVPDAAEPTAPPPPSPVRARVLVLTDNGCGSACIAFADEMRRFPGVQQIGADTYVDRLSGSAVPMTLPSGNGTVMLPTMIRNGRLRGDNVALRPAIRYDGDLGDTAAIQAWIVNTVLPQPASARAQKPARSVGEPGQPPSASPSSVK